MLNVIQAGVLCTLQGQSRYGVGHLGVCRAGPLDVNAATLGNLLLGNAPDASCLEVLGGPVQLQCAHAAWICITGAGFELSVTPGNQNPDPGWPVRLHAGQCLTLYNRTDSGTAYIAIAGGFNAAEVLGSKSTDLAAGFGGIDGRALRAGDRLSLAGPTRESGDSQLGSFGLRQLPAEPVLRALPGPEHQLLEESLLEQFWQGSWSLSPQSNRMGCRLEAVANTASTTNPSQNAGKLASLASHAVLPGTVQWPPSGNPIVLLADAQTTGGYPRVATVIQADLWRLAQLPRNSTIRFKRCSLDQAVQALAQQRMHLNRFKLALAKRYDSQPTSKV